jgi:hypothetical protein
MADVIDYEAAPERVGSPRDRRLLDAVKRWHYLWGGVLLVPHGLLLLLGVCMLPMHGLADEPGASGLRMILRLLGVAVPGAACGALTVFSGMCVARRNRHRFTTVWAMVSGAIGAVVGAATVCYSAVARRPAPGLIIIGGLLAASTALSIMTLLVLRTESVREVYRASGVALAGRRGGRATIGREGNGL